MSPETKNDLIESIVNVSTHEVKSEIYNVTFGDVPDKYFTCTLLRQACVNTREPKSWIPYGRS